MLFPHHPWSARFARRLCSRAEQSSSHSHHWFRQIPRTHYKTLTLRLEKKSSLSILSLYSGISHESGPSSRGGYQLGSAESHALQRDNELRS